MDTFSAFFTGMAMGMIFGIVIMAIAVVIGRRRDETDINKERIVGINNDLIFVKNDEEIIKMDDGKYLVRRRR